MPVLRYKDLESGRHAYIRYKGKCWHRYSYHGYDDEYEDSDPAAYTNPHTDDAPIAPEYGYYMEYRRQGRKCYSLNN